MAYYTAPIIDTTKTSYSGGTLEIPFYNTNKIAVDDYVLVRVEDAYGNALQTIFAVQAQSSTIGFFTSGITERKVVTIPVPSASQKVNGYCHIYLMFLAPDTTKPAATSWEAWTAAANNQALHSSWSEVAVFYYTTTPTTSLKQLLPQGEHIITSSSSSSGVANIIANDTFHVQTTFNFSATNETDAVEWCRFYLTRGEGESMVIIKDSGRLYATQRNIFDWNSGVEVPGSGSNRCDALYYSYRTKKGQMVIKQRLTYLIRSSMNQLTNISLYAQANKDVIQISLLPTGSSYTWLTGTTVSLARQRAGEDVWQTCAMFDASGHTVGNTGWTFYDKTTELGVPYKYRIRVFAGANQVQEQEYNVFVTALSDNIMLYTKNDSLAIVYNPTMTSLKYNSKDTPVTTLGSQYPIIYRHPYQNYRTFSIGGMIAAEAIAAWNAPSWLNSSNLSSSDQQIINERLFRDSILTTLQTHEVILCKTLQEGNLLVRLSNISLTPEKALGRRIYSFTATATEVAEPSANSYLKYFNIDPTASGTKSRMLVAEGSIENNLNTADSGDYLIVTNANDIITENQKVVWTLEADEQREGSIS